MLIFLSISSEITAQTCLHTTLSKHFNFKTILRRYDKDRGDAGDSNTVTVIVLDKANRKLQTIRFRASWLFDEAFKNRGASRSYQTGIRKRMEAVDNDYGDFIIADFNFDGRDDFAVKQDSGGNGGPLYYYYIQDSASRFRRDRFLSDKMEFFPGKILPRRKVLITYVHANAYQMGETTYRLSGQQWRRTRHRFLTVR